MVLNVAHRIRESSLVHKTCSFYRYKTIADAIWKAQKGIWHLECTLL